MLVVVAAPTNSPIESLLYELCVHLGFCLSEADQERLIADPPATIDSFVDEVVRAEGLDPGLMDRRVKAKVRTCVAKWLGPA
jgi:hypothetical protein